MPTRRTSRTHLISLCCARGQRRLFLARPLLWSLSVLGLALDSRLPVAAQDVASAPSTVPSSSPSAARNAAQPAMRLQNSNATAFSTGDKAEELAALDAGSVPTTPRIIRLAQAVGPLPDGASGEARSSRGAEAASSAEVGGVPVGESKLAPVGESKLAPGRTRVVAGRLSKEGSIITIEGADGAPAIVESGDLEAGGERIQAQSVILNIDPQVQSLRASGQVRLERSRPVSPSYDSFSRSEYSDATGHSVTLSRPLIDASRPSTSGASGSDASSPSNPAGAQSSKRRRPRQQFFTEVLAGSNLVFDGKTRTGSLDGALLQLSNLDISAASILIESTSYRARQVVLRPGGLSEAERKIYGTPPLSLRARSIDVLLGQNKTQRGHIVVRRAGLYFGNTRLLPIPLEVLSPFGLLRPRGSRAPRIFKAVPTFSLNSTDRFLLATRISFPLGGLARPRASGLSAGNSSSSFNLDLGISGRLGFRGGVSLENRSPLGVLLLQARRADVITTQLTSRLEVNRVPEVAFSSPLVPLLSLSSGRGIGAFASASAGRLSEGVVGSDAPRVQSSRFSGTVGLTTRLDERDGLYADVFATRSRYGLNSLSYTNTGFEVGYLGRLLPQVRGLLSLRQVSVSGATPFLFDVVEIPRELRTTFDIQATPRFLIPIDLRYDLDRKILRDKTVGVLRNYKTFAYGVVYQTARRDLRLEVRSDF